MSMSVSAASPSAAYAAPSLTPTLNDILAQNAAADSTASPTDATPADDATQAPTSNDPALVANLNISV